MQSDNYINTKGMIFAMINTGEEYRKKTIETNTLSRVSWKINVRKFSCSIEETADVNCESTKLNLIYIFINGTLI